MFENKNVAIVVTDPQVEFLKPAGGGYGLTKDILEEVNTIDNLTTLLKEAKERGFKVFISPHYFYPHDHKWEFGGAGEKMMIEQGMFARPNQYSEVAEGSGADFIEEIKPMLDENTIITSPHKIFGPESNDLALQLRKNGIDTVILAGMNANLCVDSHMRELVEDGFKVVVATDAIGAPGKDAYNAALTNFGFIADEVLTTAETLEKLSK
ncbi:MULTISPECIES: cysteine hydrolase [unclassified Enterococcus]|jgi:nicotinamidase-related amidase|uniref:cysteine hydrolase n=1 Tax=unclassified Enterococcus TaxID=2608891 RepID=UPI000353022B|nr:isochorismatase family protein [Enterococcus faecalis 13-SD-W-01]